MSETTDTSEDCLLDRHGLCSGDVQVASTVSVTVRRPCSCFCHRLGAKL